MSVGQRIRYWRKRRGKSQRYLADVIGRSESWLEKVERGERTADRVGDLLSIANVLKIGLGDLIGGVELPPNGGEPHDPPRGMHAIRRALMTPRLPDRQPDPIADLRADVERAKQLIKSSRYTTLLSGLPDLIMDCRLATASGDDPEAWWCLADAYGSTWKLTHALGDLQCGLVATDREVTAAQRCGDDRRVAAAHRRVAVALIGQGWIDEAGAVCSDAADAIAPTESTTPEAWSVWGSLRLTEAVAASRNGDTAGAWRLLRDAQSAADRVGSGRDDYEHAFGPANVVVHEVNVALEAGDPVEALRRAAPLDVGELPNSERRAYVCIDTAHAYQLRHDDQAAVAKLMEAERHGPENVRYSVKAHEIVRVCLKRERKSLTPGLRDLADRLKVTI